MTDDVKALIAESRVRGRKGWVEANPDLAAGLIRNLGAVLEAATVAPAVDREALATALQEQFPTGAGGYAVVWEDCLSAVDALLASGILRDVRDVQAETLERVAEEIPGYGGTPQLGWAPVPGWLRDRAQAIREVRSER